MYSINDKINYKSFWKALKFEKINNKINYNRFKECKSDYAINYSIKLHNKTEQTKAVNSGNYYCHDCSNDYNKRCTHFNYSPNYLKYINPKNSNL